MKLNRVLAASGIALLAVTASLQVLAEPAQKPVLVPAVTAPPAAVKHSPPPSLNHYLDRFNGTILQSFEAGSGLTGWYLETDFGKEILYTTADGARLLDGHLLDAEGVDLRERELFARKFAGVLEGFEGASTVVLGDGDLSLYLVFEPYCGYCHTLVRTLTKNPEVKLHLVPIAFMDEDSEQLAAALLESSDPKAILRELRSNPDSPALRTTEPAEARRAEIRSNNEVIRRFGIKGTPFMAWRDQQGKVQVHSGLPDDETLATILGKVQPVPATAKATRGNTASLNVDMPSTATMAAGARHGSGT